MPHCFVSDRYMGVSISKLVQQGKAIPFIKKQKPIRQQLKFM